MTEAHLSAFNEALNVAELATKDYVHIEVERGKNEIVRWLIGVAIAQTALIVAVLKLVS